LAANRATSAVAARIRPAITGPAPTSKVSVVPDVVTQGGDLAGQERQPGIEGADTGQVAAGDVHPDPAYLAAGADPGQQRLRFVRRQLAAHPARGELGQQPVRGEYLPAADWFYVAAPEGAEDKEGPGFATAWPVALAGPVQGELFAEPVA
jgi:hypothetical protein